MADKDIRIDDKEPQEEKNDHLEEQVTERQGEGDSNDQVTERQDEEYMDEQVTERQDEEYTDEQVTERQDEEYTDEQVTERQDEEYTDEQVTERQDEEYTDEQVTERQDEEYTDEQVTERQDEEYTDEQVTGRQSAENTQHHERKIQREGSKQSDKEVTDGQQVETYPEEEADEPRTMKQLVLTNPLTDDERYMEHLQEKDGYEEELTDRQEANNLQSFDEAGEHEGDETVRYEVSNDQTLKEENTGVSEGQEATDLTESYREYLEKQEVAEQVGEDKIETSNRSTETTQENKVHSPVSFAEGADTRITGKQPVLSPRTQYKDASATVRFLLMPSQQVATVRFGLNQTLTELKQQIATEMKIQPQVILLMFEGKKITDESTLVDLGVHPNGTIQIQVHSDDPVNHPIQVFRPRQEYHMPDVITVRISTGPDSSRDVVVEILRETTKKPMLGGYRHKKTQVIFHHASTMTMPKPRPPSGIECFSRDTQTTEQKQIAQQTTNEMATQMTKIGTYVSCKKDKLLSPGQYTNADEFRATRVTKAIIIQKYYRRWLAKNRVNRIRKAEMERRDWEKEEELLKKKEKEARIQREYERRMNPKSKEDFDLLYHALEKWRQEEEERINSTLSGAERKAALYMLLEQETQLIASIGRHKIEADSENKHKYISEFLEKAAAPKKWKGRNGKTTEMDTPYTLRAQQLKDIYNSINMKYLTQDERLDVLLTLKHTVKEHDCKLTQEIIKLIDREADLLMRGVQETNLDGLRKRISTLFLEYIKTPLFNPEAARLLKVPQDPSVLRQNIYFCPSCTRYLPSTEFKLSSNSKAVNRCRKCVQKNNEACLRQDHSHFRYMLRHVCRTEEAFGTGSKIAFLMQENDIRYLVENVWDSQSVLSAMDDLYELVLIRWDQQDEWSPWNCVLLTKEEASAHAKLENVSEAYGQEFLHRVRHKHTLAKNHFSRLPRMAEYLRSKRGNTSASTPVSAVPTLSGKRMSITPAV